MKALHAQTLLLCSLRFHWRSHLGVLLGATLATAILVGALAVGDSVRHSLERQALLRLGKVHFAVNTRDRFFREDLAGDLGKALLQPIASLVTLNGTLSAMQDGRIPARTRADVFGVDNNFWVTMANRTTKPAITMVNCVLRVERPSMMPRDASISSVSDLQAAIRKPMFYDVLGNPQDQMTRFSLRAPVGGVAYSRTVPFFLPLASLQQSIGRTGKINALLIGQNAAGTLTTEQVNAAIRKVWKLADGDLELREIPEQKAFELRTKRVFIEPQVAEAIEKAAPPAQKILTYFVNELRVEERATPYSFVTAIEGRDTRPRVSETASDAPAARPYQENRDDEIILNSWLAEDLQAKVGDSVAMKYFVVGAGRKLEERSASFRVRAVVPVEAADRELMPLFEGLADKENCRDWDAGIPIDFKRIRTKDEDYWKKYRGTPKAFVSLAAGQKLWENRFGNLTAMRWLSDNVARTSPSAIRSERADETSAPLLRQRAALEEKIRAALDPAWFGLFAQPVRAQALAAARQSQDFGQLFLGFSFFLIVAALLLMGLLFAFGVEQRTEEIGTLLALGWRPRAVRRLFLLEGLALAVAGGALGTLGGIGYTKAALWALTTRWRGAVSGTELWFHAEPMTLAIGCGASVLLAMATIWLVMRRQVRRPARELLTGIVAANLIRGGNETPRKSFASSVLITFFGALLAVVFVVWGSLAIYSPAAFFGAGMFLLVAGLGICSAIVAAVADRGMKESPRSPSAATISLRNVSRRRGRSLATVAMLACGVFLVIAIGTNRQTPKEWQQEFAHLYAETTVPLVGDMNDPKVRGDFGMPSYIQFRPKSFPNLTVSEGVTLVPMRLHDGDEASCLNLNRAQQPRLIAVNPQQKWEGIYEPLVAEFTPLRTVDATAGLWSLLDRKERDDAVPAIGDEATVRWALGKKLGETLDYLDEHGRKFPIRIVGIVANSILQGSLVISERNFVERFPSESGYRVFLLATRVNAEKMLVEGMNRALRDYGVEIRPAAERLAEFAAVENTYLSIFAALGSLGLLLGSAGLGIVVARNVMERRSELAILRAVGFPRRQVRRLVLWEHALLLLLGLACGLVAALVAVAPALMSSGAHVPYRSLALLVAALLASGAVWIWMASGAALRGNLIRSLRNE